MIPIRTSASLKALQQIKDVTADQAREIKKVWGSTTNRKAARDAVDRIINTHGVEYLGQHKRNGEHVYYCNAGDTYSTTILFMGPRLVVGDWGYLVERNLIAENNSLY